MTESPGCRPCQCCPGAVFGTHGHTYLKTQLHIVANLIEDSVHCRNLFGNVLDRGCMSTDFRRVDRHLQTVQLLDCPTGGIGDCHIQEVAYPSGIRQLLIDQVPITFKED